jgi:peptidyl-prolyl cis-trans isomerase D
MIKLIHRHNKIITYVFLFIAICFMFSGVGLDILHGGGDREQYAIKVNDKEISPLEFERAKENLTERYRRMFGENFESLAKSFNLNIAQQAVDSIVDSNLLSQEATAWGMAGSDESVNRYLLTKVFAGQEISKDAIRGLLQNLGMNYRQFSSEVKQKVSREAFTNLIRDISFVGDRDVEAQYVRQETQFSLLAATIPLDALLKQVPEPSSEALQKAYNETATSYELPARVSYEYLTFAAADFVKDVQVSPQDIELYYTENPSKFKTPEQARIRSITLLYPKDSDPKVMADLKAKAKTAHEEAISGKPFAELVQRYSDDLPTKLAGGSKGWVERGKGTKNFDKAVFAAQVGSVAELIESNTGYEIVLVEEKKEAGQKTFAEVKNEIEQGIRTREAPAYAAAKAQEVVNEVRRSSTSLSAVATSKGLPTPKVLNLGSQDRDPEPLLKGLTQKALQLPPAERLIATSVDIGDTSVVLQVKEFKEPSIQPLAEVADSVLAAYRRSEALKLAEKQAKDILDITQKDPASFEATAKSRGLTVKGPFDISRAKPSSPAFTELSGDVSNETFSSTLAPRVLGKPFKLDSGYMVVAVKNISKPDSKTPAALEQLKKYRDEATQRQAQEAVSSTVAMLKLRSNVDIDERLLTQ